MIMFRKIIQIFNVNDIRNKILFILFILIVFRLAANIPLPGVDAEKLRDFFENNQLFNLLNMFSGGGLKNISIVMLGVGPYITASIIMQLLTMIFPNLEKIYKEEGEVGRQKFNMWTRWLTIPLAALQSFGTITLFKNKGILIDLSFFDYFSMIIAATAGTIFLMWLGELITEKGIGNGISLIIFAGIVAELPTTIRQIALTWDSTQAFSYLGLGIISLLTIGGIVLVNEGQRNIPVSFAKRIRGGKLYGGSASNLPLRVNQAGVIPIIFAMSIMLFPGLVASFLTNVSNSTISYWAGKINDLFANQLFYGLLYFILVVVFTYFYTAVTFDPKSIAENLQRQGGFIPGIRPGVPTMEYLNKISNRITLTGAIFLGVVAVLPFIVQNITGIKTLAIGGTGILIVVSVVIETIKQIEAQLIMRDYEGF